MDRKRTVQIVSGLLMALLLSAVLLAAQEATPPPAQNQPAEPRADRGDRGDRGPRGFDMEGMQQRMLERMKEQLGASDQEWQIIQPRLSKVMTISRQSMTGRFMGMGGMGGRRGGGPGGDRGRFRPEGEQESPVEKAQAALQQTLEDPNASAETIKSQLTALREAREKARQELAQAQQELRDVLTVKQEAQLVTMGMLD